MASAPVSTAPQLQPPLRGELAALLDQLVWAQTPHAGAAQAEARTVPAPFPCGAVAHLSARLSCLYPRCSLLSLRSGRRGLGVHSCPPAPSLSRTSGAPDPRAHGLARSSPQVQAIQAQLPTCLHQLLCGLPPTLRAARMATVHGIRSKPELNGRRVSVLAETANGRFQVRRRRPCLPPPPRPFTAVPNTAPACPVNEPSRATQRVTMVWLVVWLVLLSVSGASARAHPRARSSHSSRSTSPSTTTTPGSRTQRRRCWRRSPRPVRAQLPLGEGGGEGGQS